MQIKLIIVYFGRVPGWIKYFLKSCEYNPNINWLIYSDMEIDDLIPDNIQLINAQLNDFNKIASEKLGFKVSITNPYKLCDFKPVYGEIFSEYIRGFKFWGYCDMDIIFGKIENFISEKHLLTYDIISARRHPMGGYFVLYRNSESFVKLFRKIWRFEYYLKKVNYYFYLDEKSNYVGYKLPDPDFKPSSFRTLLSTVSRSIRFRLLNMLPFKYDMTRVISHEEKGGNIKVLTLNHVRQLTYYFNNNIDNWMITWERGQLIENMEEKEILFFHFFNSLFGDKTSVSFKDDEIDRFIISNGNNIP